MSGQVRAMSADARRAVPHSELKDRIIVIASQGALFEGLTGVIGNRLPQYDVELYQNHHAIAPEHGSIKLIVLHASRHEEAAATAQLLHQAYPTVPLGYVVDEPGVESSSDGLLNAHIVQGIWPTNFQLDMWIAAMSILLNGGECRFPARAPARSSVTAHLPSKTFADSGAVVGMKRGVRDAIAETYLLTSREFQILELVAQGYQNKLIADRMRISEQTVKVHVHNLIAKLRVTNRTQAAAIYRTGDRNGAMRPLDFSRSSSDGA